MRLEVRNAPYYRYNFPSVEQRTFLPTGPVLLGNPLAFLATMPIFQPSKGEIIKVGGSPAALSMGVVAALGGAILLVAVLKKKGAL